jgi:putative oxidoreductase
VKIVLHYIATICLAAIFFYAGIVKVTDVVSFYHDIQAYRLVPDEIAWYSAHYLPWVEIVVGVGLIIKRTRGSASFLVSVSLIIFMAAILSAWDRKLNIECGCFGTGFGSSDYTWLLARDLLFLFTACYVAATTLSKTSKSELIRQID